MTSGATMRYSNFRKDERSGEAFFIGGYMLTQEKLKELVNYNELTGIFTWKISRTGVHKDTIAGTNSAYGYTQIKVCGKLYLAHRLAWFYVYGVWPINEIDHIDGVKTNNCIGNLRDVTRQVNEQNKKIAQCNNTNGFRGVSFCKLNNKYKARITINGKQKHLGLFLTPEEAHDVYIIEKRKYHSGCTI